MSNGYLFAILLGSCILSASGQEGTNCSASEEDELMKCYMKYPSFLPAILVAGNDSDKMMEALCSEAGREYLGCALDFQQRCPVLSTDEDVLNTSLPINMTEIVSVGGPDLFCDLMTGGPCADLVKCFEMDLSSGSDMGSMPDITQHMSDGEAFKEAKQYLFFQQQTAMTCGPLKPMMECLLTGMEQCPAMKEQVSEQMNNMMQQGEQGIIDVKVMTFDEMTYILQTQCPILPQGFASDDCLPTQLMSSVFTTCHKNFSDTYNTMVKKQNCEAYEALEGCFNDNVEPQCGAATSSFMTRNTPLMVDGISSVCVTGGSSKPLATSIIIMMAALFVTMDTML